MTTLGMWYCWGENKQEEKVIKKGIEDFFSTETKFSKVYSNSLSDLQIEEDGSYPHGLTDL